jgi:uncharacterized protein
MTKDNSILLDRIKKTVLNVEPSADIILYGSYARGEQKEESDIDLLILVSNNNLSYEDRKKISYPLFNLEAEVGISISPLIYDKGTWENKHYVTPFYKNIKEDGILL